MALNIKSSNGHVEQREVESGSISQELWHATRFCFIMFLCDLAEITETFSTCIFTPVVTSHHGC